MRKIASLAGILFIILLNWGCESDSKNVNDFDKSFIAAFSEESVGYSKIVDSYEVEIKFSQMAVSDGEIKLRIVEKNAAYGIDYKTNPAVVNKEITVPIVKGTMKSNVLFENLIYPFDRDDKTVQFEIVSIDYPMPTMIQGYSVLMISFDASLGGVIAPNIGGSREQNQVYVELSSQSTKEVLRDSWDLAFYSGTDNRVKINGAIYMAAASLTATEMNSIRSSDVEHLKRKVAIGTFDVENVKYIDHPSGDLRQTAIAEVQDNDDENRVYLLNLGFEIPEQGASNGGVNVAGKSRGWKKIRILKRDNGYLLQHADLDDPDFREIFISKNPVYNFQFFSFNTNAELLIEPAKGKWDLNFTVFTNINEAGSYGYSDFIVNNRYGDVRAYPVTENQAEALKFENFKLSDLDEGLFLSDLRTIGSSWREVADGKKLNKGVYYIIKDGKGNYYKIRMLAFLNEQGERGYPKFEYKLLR